MSDWTNSNSIQVTLTLWGQDAENFDGAAHPIIFVKGGKINEFGGGKSISLTSGSTMKSNPDISEAHQLRGWYDNDGRNQDFSSVSARSVKVVRFQSDAQSFKLLDLPDQVFQRTG